MKKLGIGRQNVTSDEGRFYIKTLNEAEVEEQCHVEISRSFLTLGNLANDVNVNRVRETVALKCHDFSQKE